MEYAQARDCITFLQFCSKSQLEFFIEKIVGLIEQSIETSTPQLVDRGLFNSTFFRTYKTEEKKNHLSGDEDIFCKPNMEKLL